MGANDAFCGTAPPKPYVKQAPLPEMLYCHNAAKFSKEIVDKKNSRTCGAVHQDVKKHWDSIRLDPEEPQLVTFFKTCCEVRTIPAGKKLKRFIQVVKKRVVKATTTVGLDFTEPKNQVKKEKFEKAYIRRAKATSGTFTYTKKSNRRRHLAGDSLVTATSAGGSLVTAILDFDDDAAAEAGKATLNGANFGTGLQQDLKADGVDTTVAKSTAVVETVDTNVVVEELEDDEDATTTTATKPTTTKAGNPTTTEAGNPTTTQAGNPTTTTTTEAANPAATTAEQAVSAGTTMLSNQIFILLVAMTLLL